MSKTILQIISKFCSEAYYDMLPSEVTHQAKRCLIDFFGCAIAASKMDCYSNLIQYFYTVGGVEEAHIWGTDKQIPMPNAALVNGTITHHLDMDDGHSDASVHPAISIIPAALAVGEKMKSSGKELILSLVLGYEVIIRIGLITKKGIVQHEVHGPGMLGPIGAATASAKLLGLNDEGIHNSISLAGSLLPVAPFQSFVEGVSTKDFYGGWSGFLGGLAAEFAGQGLTGPEKYLEGKRSLGQLLLHQSVSSDSERLKDLGSKFEILDVYFKPFSTARSVQPAITAALKLSETHRIETEDIERIRVETYPRAVNASQDSIASNSISARLNIPFTVAWALYHGSPTHRAFTEDALADEDVVKLSRKVEVTAGTRSQPLEKSTRWAKISIWLHNGEKLIGESSRPLWDDHLAPSDGKLEEKFILLTGESPTARKLISTLWAFEEIKNLDIIPKFLCQINEEGKH